MITFNNTIKSTLSEVEIKGKTVNGVSCGIDNADGTFKITILTTNGLPASDGNYQECKQDIYMPCKLGQVGAKQDILRFDKGSNRFILEQQTNNGTSALTTSIIHYIDTCLNTITYDGKTTLFVQSGTVEATVKAICPKTMLTSQKFIVNKIREIIASLTTHYQDIVSLKKKDIDLQTQINTKSESTHRHNNVTTTTDGFMSKEDKGKLNGIANNANNYVHPNDANTRHVTDSQIASWNAKPTVSDVDNKIKEVVGSAPQALDTLKEIGDALGNDANFAGTMTTQLAGKAPLIHDHNNTYYTKNETDSKYLGKTEKAESAKYADTVDWESIGGKPSVFTPSSHTHDERYYTESESDNRFLGKLAKAESAKISDSVAWDNVTGKPSTYAPSSHVHDDRYFTESKSDIRYYRNDCGIVTDFNIATTSGIYTISTSNTLPNSPSTGSMYGTLEVVPRGTDLIQRVTTSGGLMYYRYYGKDSLAWRAWVQVFTNVSKPTWNDVSDKPASYNPSEHNHDDRYYTETEVNNLLNNKVNTSDFSSTVITKNLNIGSSWVDTGITGTNLGTGSYMVQISGMATTTGLWYEIFTGTMSWYSGATNSTDTDEILLHKAGHASTNRTLYLRTIRVSSGTMKLQIASNATLGASDYTFKFRKLI